MRAIPCGNVCAKVPMTNGSNDFAHLHNECKFERICFTCVRVQTNKRLFRTADRQNQRLNKLLYEKEQGSSTSEAKVLPVNGECLTYGSLYGLA